MKKIFITILFILGGLSFLFAQDLDFLNLEECTFKLDEVYGADERNRFDIIMPNTQTPTALIIFIHGGGFKHGDKRKFYKRNDDICYFIENNIAVATLNYRFRNDDDSIGVKLCLRDVQQAIQYIRFNANRYHIDKTSIGLYGISAGAGSSLYFAFHDDLAIAGDTTLLGESTRVKCAGAIATQSTYDVFSWLQIVPCMRLVVALKRRMFLDFGAKFYGYPNYKSFKTHKKSITAELDMLNMIDSLDPPIYLMNLLSGSFPKNDNIIQHHRKHAKVVAKELTRNKVENYLYTDKQVKREKDIDYPIRQFLVDKLK